MHAFDDGDRREKTRNKFARLMDRHRVWIVIVAQLASRMEAVLPFIGNLVHASRKGEMLPQYRRVETH
jgi:hypothetical protein